MGFLSYHWLVWYGIDTNFPGTYPSFVFYTHIGCWRADWSASVYDLLPIQCVCCYVRNIACWYISWREPQCANILSRSRSFSQPLSSPLGSMKLTQMRTLLIQLFSIGQDLLVLQHIYPEPISLRLLTLKPFFLQQLSL